MREYGVIVIEIGGRGHLGDDVLREMQAAPALTHAHSPEAPISLTLGGYDDDPRPICQIPEAAAYVRRYAAGAGLSDWRGELFLALDDSTKGLLILCGAIAEPHPFTVNVISNEEWIARNV